METVYDPNTQGQVQYMPQQQEYNPQQQQSQQQWPPQPQPLPQQTPQGGQQSQPQQQWPQQTPQVLQQSWPQQTPQGGQQQQVPRSASPVVKLQCRFKQMERKNLLMMDGYINNIRLTQATDGTVTRIGFLLAWESFVYENGQQVFNADGNPAIKDVRFAMQAWGQVAQALAQLPVGTPVLVYANANRWNSSRPGEPSNWQTDFKVFRFEVL